MVNGATAAWYRSTRPHREGHLHAGDVDIDVTFVDMDAEVNGRIEMRVPGDHGLRAEEVSTFGRDAIDRAAKRPQGS